MKIWMVYGVVLPTLQLKLLSCWLHLFNEICAESMKNVG